MTLRVRERQSISYLLSVLLVLCLFVSAPGYGQSSSLSILNQNRPVLDAHNCYPYDGQWKDRVARALKTGFPVGIEQDLAWYVDPSTGKGRVVVTHKAETNGSEPTLHDYFFEQVRPIIEAALKKGDRSHWPLVVVHFDFKDNSAPLIRAVWELLGQYQDWITTATKTSDPHKLAPLEVKPLLVLTEDPDAQEEIFFKEVSPGAKLRIFGSAHTHAPQTKDKEELSRLLVTTPPQQLLPDPPSDYRRWWNNSWHEVEQGGQQKAGAWTKEDAARLRALVDHAHRLGYWIRFYTLDGFDQEAGRKNGWFDSYNFGTRQAVTERWAAALQAGVDLIATDQYEDLAAFMKQ